MNFTREQSSITVDNSFFHNKDLNDTQLSFMTKNSGEKDFKELASLINTAVRDDKENMSIFSAKNVDKSNSIISNEEIWTGNKSPDDSKNFIENFNDIREKKKKSNFSNEFSLKKSQKMTRKPKHLIINTQVPKIDAAKEEDYNEEIDESLGPIKEEQVNQIGNLETKNNNLNELHVANSLPSYSDSFKYYTCPDDYTNYRSSYPFTNFSFTPYSHPSFTENFQMNYFQPYHVFPTVEENIDPTEVEGNRERESSLEEEDSLKKCTLNTHNQNQSNNANTRQRSSTRNSTESNESGADGNASNPYCRKYYTPTHQNIKGYPEYNLSKVQRELDFQGIRNSTALNNNANNTMNFHKNFNKFNGTATPNIIGNNMTKMGNKITNPFCHNIAPQYTYPNATTPTNNKSMSFCANMIKSPTGINYNLSDTKPKASKCSIGNQNTGYNNPFSTEPRIAHAKSEEILDYKINLENILIGKDKRTTIMIRNIPNKYTLGNLVEEINVNFLGKYDYINLPVDYERKLNLGYSFINFVDPFHIVLFYDTYYNKKWTKYRSDKKIDLNYAEKQGKKDITCRDENTYFAMEDNKINFKKLIPKTEFPIRYLDFFKKIYPNSVCISENKHAVTGEKTFYVKTLGKRL